MPNQLIAEQVAKPPIAESFFRDIDTIIDRHRDSLRLFRNGMFHYQPDARKNINNLLPLINLIGLSGFTLSYSGFSLLRVLEAANYN